MDLEPFIKLFISLVSIINPFGAIPIYLNITSDKTANQRIVVCRIVFFSITTILLVSGFMGSELLSFFGISLHSFRIAGGIVVFSIGYMMLMAQTSRMKNTREEEDEAAEKDSIAVVPLSMPLLVGPGTISAVILFSESMETPVDYLLLCLVVIGTAGAVWTILRLAPKIARYMGQIGINVTTRIMGLILTALAVEFIVQGIKASFPVLGSP
jgi:multiple antibiotic resistance protein